jgi:hypothetical protein
VLHSTNFQLKASERDISAIQAITIVKDTENRGKFFRIIWGNRILSVPAKAYFSNIFLIGLY